MLQDVGAAQRAMNTIEEAIANYHAKGFYSPVMNWADIKASGCETHAEFNKLVRRRGVPESVCRKIVRQHAKENKFLYVHHETTLRHYPARDVAPTPVEKVYIPKLKRAAPLMATILVAGTAVPSQWTQDNHPIGYFSGHASFYAIRFSDPDQFKHWCDRLMTNPECIKALGFTPTGKP